MKSFVLRFYGQIGPMCSQCTSHENRTRESRAQILTVSGADPAPLVAWDSSSLGPAPSARQGRRCFGAAAAPGGNCAAGPEASRRRGLRQPLRVNATAAGRAAGSGPSQGRHRFARTHSTGHGSGRPRGTPAPDAPSAGEARRAKLHGAPAAAQHLPRPVRRRPPPLGAGLQNLGRKRGRLGSNQLPNTGREATPPGGGRAALRTRPHTRRPHPRAATWRRCGGQTALPPRRPCELWTHLSLAQTGSLRSPLDQSGTRDGRRVVADESPPAQVRGTCTRQSGASRRALARRHLGGGAEWSGEQRIYGIWNMGFF